MRIGKAIMLLIAGAGLGMAVITRGPGIPEREFQALGKALKKNEVIVDYAVEDTKAFLLVSTDNEASWGELFLVLERKKEKEWVRVYENDFTGLKPWKLELGDVDGDGITDILTAVRKTTYYDQQEKNRLFIFDYQEAGLVKKWTGSDIAGNWMDFEVGELVDTKGEEIVFLSREGAGKDKLFVYAWYDFGFLMLAQSGEYEELLSAELYGKNRLCLTHSKGKDFLMLKENKIVKAE
jgi:hypothetical protein